MSALPNPICFDDGSRGVRWEDETLSGRPWPESCARCGSCAGSMRLVDGELVHSGDCYGEGDE